MLTTLYCDSLFFFNDTATTEIYTLSLHDALPICLQCSRDHLPGLLDNRRIVHRDKAARYDLRQRLTAPGMLADCDDWQNERSEEHTSELQSRQYLVCRLLLEKKKQYKITTTQGQK